ncbi:MAG: cell envelope biogenesis protein OmpA [Alphaproteobacteria bacterium]|nr:MAG: cell envelope biogenesis protein OmpA [Alphaproteobacteria bacterium]
MNAFKSLALTTAVLAVTACSAFEGNNEVDKLNEATASGSPFTQQLTSEYRAFSNYELNSEKDYADALHFARKGLEAAAGTVVMPEPVNDWDLTAADIAELSTAYGRLVSAFDRGAREVLPGKSAIAQARYDCWIEEQEEVANGEAAAVPCKADFLAIMPEIEAALPAQVVAPEAFPEPVSMIDGNEPLNVAEAMYLVFFDFDSKRISNGGLNVLDTVVQEVQSRNLQTIRVVGHTDTSGSAAYNARLANTRANKIKSELISRGISASSIITEGRGENELLVQTTDATREPANRRGVITFD